MLRQNQKKICGLMVSRIRRSLVLNVSNVISSVVQRSREISCTLQDLSIPLRFSRDDSYWYI